MSTDLCDPYDFEPSRTAITVELDTSVFGQSITMSSKPKALEKIPVKIGPIEGTAVVASSPSFEYGSRYKIRFELVMTTEVTPSQVLQALFGAEAVES